MVLGFPGFALAAQPIDQPRLLVGREPPGGLGPFGAIAPHDEAKQHGGEALEQEQPLPTGESPGTLHTEQGTGHRAANQAGNRGRCHERRDRPGTLASGATQTVEVKLRAAAPVPVAQLTPSLAHWTVEECGLGQGPGHQGRLD